MSKQEIISVEALSTLSNAVLERVGVPEADRIAVTRILVEAS